MKRTGIKRLALGRETVKTLVADELRRVAAGQPSDSSSTETMSPGPTYGCTNSCVRCQA
jgi:hypothetical protein